MSIKQYSRTSLRTEAKQKYNEKNYEQVKIYCHIGGRAVIQQLAAASGMSMAEYIRTNMSQAGRSGLSVEEVPVRELIRPASDARERKVSVASLRLDSVVGAAFGLSRSKALEAVRSGIVFVNGLETLKPDYPLQEGDKVVMRHRGRTILKEVGGKTGKGRTHITLQIYR